MKNEIEHISAAVRGDSKSFAWLYNQYSNSLFLTCLRYFKSREEAEDILQESFIRIFNGLKSYDFEKSKFITWANRITINTILEFKRKKRIQLHDSSMDDLKLNLEASYNVLAKMEVDEVLSVMSNMPDGYRTIFNLYYFEGYTHQEIADELSISLSTSKTQLMKAKAAVKNSFNDKLIVSKI
jgi:RNA polymerase sigma factor (sigma-70 family)